MIVKTLCELVYSFFNLFLSPLSIPSMSDKFDLLMEYFHTFLDNAAPMVNLFLPWSIVEWGMPLVIASVLAVDLYRFIMWVLRKVPMVGID